jgi:multisubunit Na+/H+ antiporter MnhG subunit
MIQRIQTIYLLIASVAFALLSFKIPFWRLNDEFLYAQNDNKLYLLLVSLFVFSIICVFLFKNRTVQMKLLRLSILIEFVVVVRLFLTYKELNTPLDAKVFFLLMSAFVALLLAYRGVRKDENLVRSVDRIR